MAVVVERISQAYVFIYNASAFVVLESVVAVGYTTVSSRKRPLSLCTCCLTTCCTAPCRVEFSFHVSDFPRCRPQRGDGTAHCATSPFLRFHAVQNMRRKAWHQCRQALFSGHAGQLWCEASTGRHRGMFLQSKTRSFPEFTCWRTAAFAVAVSNSQPSLLCMTKALLCQRAG
jgi:hypothetical protein